MLNQSQFYLLMELEVVDEFAEMEKIKEELEESPEIEYFPEMIHQDYQEVMEI